MTIKYFTPEGLDNLKQELQTLKTKGRADVAAALQEAREKGDLSENAEYDAAKDAQGMLEMKISHLETELGMARLLDESKLDVSKIMILSKVKLKNLKFNKVIDYMIVTDKEADLKQGKISISTPIAQGLLGKMVGDVVTIQVPSGAMDLEVLEVSR
ncbi:MAG: transcription elongation factor GreA [Chitinophagales bacterium]|jgi:transcription elongation factor GreA|nr:transcription elongation factor GreA [Sphingobacteriales bacterium]MBP6665197.1 transcription elongation factor GreA [Chitinophagales bacterium]MBP7532925.1 transcription elongation factor GreA [Chitinophagales bacterium]